MIKKYIRDIENFPINGVTFRDITPLLLNPIAFKLSIIKLIDFALDQKVEMVAGIESRGFIFASALATELNLPLCLIRKPGKLPLATYKEIFELEYGTSALCIHEDTPGKRVLTVDDVLATGGTVEAAIKLMRRINCPHIALAFLMELTYLNGKEKTQGLPYMSCVSY